MFQYWKKLSSRKLKLRYVTVDWSVLATFMTLLARGERNRFDAEVGAALKDYLNVATRYNEKVLRLNSAVVASIQADPVLGPLVADYKSMRGGPLLYPYEFV